MKQAVNPYQQYQNNQIDTADPKQLIVMLYEGAVRFLEAAVDKIEDFRTYDDANSNILRAQDILTELMLSLDMEKGGEIASNLFNLYAYMKKELLDANVSKEKAKIATVIALLRELKEAWDKVDASGKPADVSAVPKKPDDYEGFAAQG